MQKWYKFIFNVILRNLCYCVMYNTLQTFISNYRKHTSPSSPWSGNTFFTEMVSVYMIIKWHLTLAQFWGNQSDVSIINRM